MENTKTSILLPNNQACNLEFNKETREAITKHKDHLKPYTIYKVEEKDAEYVSKELSFNFSELSQEAASAEAVQIFFKYLPTIDQDPEEQVKAIGQRSSLNKLVKFVEDAKLTQMCTPASLKEEINKNSKILVLMDIGGSFCYRGKKLFCKPNRHPDYAIRSHFHYFRPYWAEYLRFLLIHPRTIVGFYTSITRRNAMPLVYKIFENKQVEAYKKNFCQLFDQDYCAPDVLGPDNWSTKRDLKKVWEDKAVKEYEFDKDSTLVIDSSWLKVRDYQENSLVVPPYTEHEVKNPKDQPQDQLNMLQDLKTYIEDLLDSEMTVPQYLKENPFEFARKKPDLTKQFKNEELDEMDLAELKERGIKIVESGPSKKQEVDELASKLSEAKIE